MASRSICISVLAAAGFQLNPTTPESYDTYTQIGRQPVARVFGGWLHAMSQSSDVESFASHLAAFAVRLDTYEENHDALIITLQGVPAWLSTSDDATPIDDLWTVANTQTPKDLRVWRDLCAMYAAVLETVDVPVYLEFWNEPEWSWKAARGKFIYLMMITKDEFAHLDHVKFGGPAAQYWWSGYIDAVAEVELDFVSWHAFESTNEITFGSVYASSVAPGVEQVVTEWNLPMQDAKAAFDASAVTHHAFSVWEEWHPGSGDAMVGYGGDPIEPRLLQWLSVFRECEP